MTPTEYIEAAVRTGGYQSKFYGNLVPLRIYNIKMLEFKKAADALDVMKKSMFYGRENAYAHFENELTLEGMHTQKLIDAIHGIVGVATEAGELVEALSKPSLDEVNIKEEMGDILWYIAVLCKTMNCTFEEIMITNINKLKTRFPERFNETNALNRNLDAERKVLEDGETGDNDMRVPNLPYGDY